MVKGVREATRTPLPKGGGQRILEWWDTPAGQEGRSMTTLSPDAWRPRALPPSLAAVKLLNSEVQGKEHIHTRLDDSLTHPWLSHSV